MYDELLGDEAETRAVWAALTGMWRVLAYAVLLAAPVVGVAAVGVTGVTVLDGMGLLPSNRAALGAVGILLACAGAGIGGSLGWAAVRALAGHRSPNGVLILATPTTSAQPSHVRVVTRQASDAA